MKLAGSVKNDRCAGTEPKGIQQILVSDRDPAKRRAVSQRPWGRQMMLKKVYMYVFQTVITVSIKQVKQGIRARWEGTLLWFCFVKTDKGRVIHVYRSWTGGIVILWSNITYKVS